MTRTYESFAHYGVACLAALLVATSAAAGTLVQIRDIDMDALRVAGFELKRSGPIQVEAVGLRWQHSDDLNAYAWILDTKTRQPVWVMQDRRTDRYQNDRRLRRATTTLDLEPGKYELYYWAGSGFSVDHGWSLGRWLRDGFQIHWDSDGHDPQDDEWEDPSDEDADDAASQDDTSQDDVDKERDERRERRRSVRFRSYNPRDFDKALDHCFVRLDSDRLGSGDVESFEPDGGAPDALIRHIRLGNSEYIEDAFRLSRNAKLHIYSVFEFPEDWRHPVDHGWILNAASRERVWDLDYRNTRPAGGSDKNRMFDDDIELPAGDYVLVFGTDDSHSFEEFNARPPLDPINWGVTVRAASDADKRACRRIDVPSRGEPFVELRGVRDNEYVEQPFRVKKAGTIQAYGMGEYSFNSNEFADYGWIERADDESVVWEMTRRNTEHAGGAEKNRMFDGNVELEPGDYVAVYITDDSHSSRRWNSEAPFDAEAWGLTLYPGSLKAKDIETLSSKEDMARGQELVNLTRVGDRERLHESFTLDKETKVRVYAVGEGVDGEMYDYGYIVNEDNRTVWEMTFRRSRHAGGARKNRVADKILTLPAGRYTVYYETDGSHSFPNWNDTRPRDPRAWGITVSQVQ